MLQVYKDKKIDPKLHIKYHHYYQCCSKFSCSVKSFFDFLNILIFTSCYEHKITVHAGSNKKSSNHYIWYTRLNSIFLEGLFHKSLKTFGPPPSGKKVSMKLPLSVGQYVRMSVNQFSIVSKMIHRIFLKFQKLLGPKGQKLMKWNCTKNFSCWKKVPNSSKIGFFSFSHTFNPLMCLF